MALIAGLVLVVIALGVIAAGTMRLRANRQLTDTHFLLEGQATQVAQSGLIEALNWLRRQDVQPVVDFEPRYDPAASPPVIDTLDPDIGLVREFHINGDVWGRYEVWKAWDADPDPARAAFRDQVRAVDISQFIPESAEVASVWLVRSVGYIYRRRQPNRAFDAGPNQVIAKRVMEAEFGRPYLSLPGQAAVSTRSSAPFVLHEGARVLGGSATGVYYDSTNGNPTIKGMLTGQPALAPTTVYDDSAEAIFGVSEDRLRAMADFYITDKRDFPVPVPPLSIVFVEASVSSLTFGPDNPLLGSGLVYVQKNVNIQEDSRSRFNGLLHVGGSLNMKGPATISGSLILKKSGNLNDGVTIRYDDRVLAALAGKIGNYRLSSAIRQP